MFGCLYLSSIDKTISFVYCVDFFYVRATHDTSRRILDSLASSPIRYTGEGKTPDSNHTTKILLCSTMCSNLNLNQANDP